MSLSIIFTSGIDFVGFQSAWINYDGRITPRQFLSFTHDVPGYE